MKRPVNINLPLKMNGFNNKVFCKCLGNVIQYRNIGTNASQIKSSVYEN